MRTSHLARGNMQNRRSIALLLVLGMSAPVTATQNSGAIPSVASAQVPFYPPLPQRAHMEGTVRLKITTDGRRTSSIEGISGIPMLVQAARENAKTWEFEPHSPTTFSTVFRYRLLPSKCDSACNCESIEAPVIVLHLPLEVEINAMEMMICDPQVERK